MPIAPVEDIFAKCSPAIGTDIKRCGAISICDINTPTAEELEGIYQDGSGNWRMMDALFMQDFEIRMCGTIQNTLYDFLMAQRVNMSKRLTRIDLGRGRYQIMPFVLADQQSIFNNEYWTVSSGTASGETNWQVDVTSQTGVPADIRWFNPPERVYIWGLSAGGSHTATAWRIISATAVGTAVRLILASENANSALAAANLENPVNGVLSRGTPNVNDYEQFCEQPPGVNLSKLVPFFHETTRMTLCSSELYDNYRDELVRTNKMFAKFGDIAEPELNRQLGLDWQKRWVNSFFWNKPLANQNINDWPALDDISVVSSDNFYMHDEGNCVGKRANATGIYEQLAACGRVRDAQGQVFNLQEFFEILYSISRVRETLGLPSDLIESVTDSRFAALIQQAMMNYFDLKAGGRLRVNFDISSPPTHGKFGFRFKDYFLDFPVLTWRVMSHKYFDDRVTAHGLPAGDMGATGRQLWTVDWSGIYPGIIDTNRVVHDTQQLKALAAVNASYACVMKVPTRRVTMTSTTYAPIVDCPDSSYIIVNIPFLLPEHEGSSGGTPDAYGAYPG